MNLSTQERKENRAQATQRTRKEIYATQRFSRESINRCAYAAGQIAYRNPNFSVQIDPKFPKVSFQLKDQTLTILETPLGSHYLDLTQTDIKTEAADILLRAWEMAGFPRDTEKEDWDFILCASILTSKARRKGILAWTLPETFDHNSIHIFTSKVTPVLNQDPDGNLFFSKEPAPSPMLVHLLEKTNASRTQRQTPKQQA